MKFKTGDIVFFNWENKYSKLIRLFNLVKYGEKGWAHVGIITKVKKNKIQIHEAIGKGFTCSYYTKDFLEEKIKYNVIKVKKVKHRLSNVENNANEYLGKEYAWFDIIGIGLSFILRWKFIKITGASKLICSEAVSRILYDSSNKNINFEKEYNKPYDLITPMDLYLSNQL